MAKDWIKGAIKHKGALRKAAANAGMSTHAYAEKHKADGGTLGRRARLALTLSGMHGNGKSKMSTPGDTRGKNATLYQIG